MTIVQTKTLITLTLKLSDLEIDVTKEVSLDQLLRINAQAGKIYEDSNSILGKISLSTILNKCIEKEKRDCFIEI